MFEAFTHKPTINRGRWLSLSVVGHALLLLLAWRAMLVFQASPPVAPERTQVTFFSSPPPPPPPPSGAKSRPKERKIKRDVPKVQPSEIVQPKEPEPAEKDEPEGAGEVGGVVGGVEGGVVGGVVGGTIGEYDGRIMSPPKLVSGPPIEYTQKALENDVEGLMIVRCVVGFSGELRDCRVQQSVRFMDAAVVAALEKRRYTPVTLQNGRPVEVFYNFRIRLNLPR